MPGAFAKLEIEHPMMELLGRVRALWSSCSAYDAMYVVLGGALDAPLVTTDLRLARAKGHGAKILAPP